MAHIETIKAREILDSRGNPTVEADVILTSGEIGRASVPSGASTGSHEAVERRDQDKKRYLGKGVLQAVDFIQHDLAKALKGFDVRNQQELDDALIQLDGTKNKSRLGANTLLAVSLAAAKASALSLHQPLYAYLGHGKTNFLLPVPMMNIINGGAHADNSLDFQEFMILPVNFTSFSDSLRAGVEVFHHLKALLKTKGYSTNVGDEGGFAPDLPNHAAAVECILEAITRAGYSSRDIYLGLDVASTEFYRDKHYHLSAEKKKLTSEEWLQYLTQFAKQYQIVSIEDGMAEDDWQGWSLLTKALGDKVQLVGDDLFVTNTELLQQGIKQHIANAILIKPNQIGTLTETIAAINMAKEANYNTIISHRSGETEDTTIADLAVATSAGQIKTGSLSRSDRIAKYNQLLRIESELRDKGKYTGNQIFAKLKLNKDITVAN